LSVPKSWDQKAHAEWAAGRRAQALQIVLPRLSEPSDSPALALQSAYYLFLDQAYEPARIILGQASAQFPDDLPLLLNLAVLESRTGRNDSARALLERYLKLGGKETAAYDGLCTACHRLGDDEAARQWGERSIAEKTELASNEDLTLGEPRPSGANIISFSLWGDHPRYLRGALHNALRARLVYPGWQCRFYVDASVPADLLGALSALGADLIVDEGLPPTRERLTRRFLVADDPGVAAYLVRDCDSLINAREAAAVGVWLAGGKLFHVMRDWWTHTDPILAGMWGGLGGVLPPMKPLLDSYRSKSVETPNWDQWFLRDRIWPGIRKQSLVHDRLFRTEGSTPFPGQTPAGNLHVGQNEYAVRKAEQAAELAHFKDRVPSLRL